MSDELRKELARLHGMLARHGVHVLTRPPEYPSSSQFGALLDIVTAAYPRLLDPHRLPPARADELKHEFRNGFEAAFLPLCFFHRRDRVDPARSPSYWSDAAKDLAQRQGWQSEWSLMSFEAAVAAHGDVVHTMPPVDAMNFTMQIGLQLGTEPNYSAQWRREHGRVSPPVEIGRPPALAS